jgi:Fe-S oxidoreductase
VNTIPVKTFQDYIPIYDGDRYCLMCRHVCPVERVTKREATTPHGWALLIASVIRGSLQWDADTVDTLYQCSDCANCQANCATDRPLPAALKAARAEVVRLGKQPASVIELDRKLREWGNPYGENSSQLSVVSGQHSDVGLYVGATAQFLRPQAIEAAQKLLGATGIHPVLLSVGRSSGYLPYALGLWDIARDLAQQTLAEIDSSGVREVITLTAEDAHAIKHVYYELGLMPPRQVRVLHIAEYLAPQAARGQLKIRPLETRAATYHDPCHALALPDHASAARKLIVALTGSAPREMLWREKRAAPCGATGGLEFTQPWLAEAMAKKRLDGAREIGAEIVLTDDPHCVSHLIQHADGLSVQNLIEVLAEQMD